MYYSTSTMYLVGRVTVSNNLETKITDQCTGSSEDQQRLHAPSLSSRLLEIAASNFYDEQNNGDQNIEEICHCDFFLPFAKAIMPRHNDVIDDFPTAKDTSIEARPTVSKTPATLTTMTPCRKCTDEDNHVDDDEATAATAATDNCSFVAWDAIDLPHSPRPKSMMSTTCSPLQSSTKLIQRYSNTSSLSSRTSDKPKRSSSGSGSTCRSYLERRRVSFLAGYVSEIHVQPRVSAEDWSKVFYSPREIQL